MNLTICATLAWRNVWRNKRRTLLTFLTIFVGTGMVIWMTAWGKGSHDQMINDLVYLNTGHIQVHEKGFHDNQTIDYAFLASEALMTCIQKNPHISGFSKRIHAGGLISYDENTAGTLVQAVDPETEKTVSDIYSRILPGGRYLEKNGKNQILLGEILAKNLSVSVGDEISLISQGFDGSIAAGKFNVTGLFRTSNPEYDRALTVMSLHEANDMFAMEGYIHSICIKVSDIDDLEKVKAELIKATKGESLEVMGWDTLMPEIVQFIEMDNVSIYIFDFILLIVVAFTMLNTIQMTVFERIREFGVMVSIGTRPGQVVSMILYESCFISIMGVFLGIFLGWAMSYYFKVNPLDYSEYAKELSSWGISTTVFPTDATAKNITMSALIIFVLTIIFSLFPALKASRLKPVDAIRHL